MFMIHTFSINKLRLFHFFNILNPILKIQIYNQESKLQPVKVNYFSIAKVIIQQKEIPALVNCWMILDRTDYFSYHIFEMVRHHFLIIS